MQDGYQQDLHISHRKSLNNPADLFTMKGGKKLPHTFEPGDKVATVDRLISLLLDPHLLNSSVHVPLEQTDPITPGIP